MIVRLEHWISLGLWFWQVAALPSLTSVISDKIPLYAFEYAPVVWLYSEEHYFPSDITTHLNHVHAVADGQNLGRWSTSSLDLLNTAAGSRTVHLTSNEGILAKPAWFHGTYPDVEGSLPDARASAIIIVPKNDSIVDVFYFYFNSYNQGQFVLGRSELEFGDHVGDWEHNMIRFRDGIPESMWYSQHEFGEAFDFEVVEKHGITARPVTYVANGTHALYATTGSHDHTIPYVNAFFGPLTDHTDKGTYWDPLLNAYTYMYDVENDLFVPIGGDDPVGWLYYDGRWGDPELPHDAPGQRVVFGRAKYVQGPKGPKDKNLGRKRVCLREKGCWIRPFLTP